MNEPQIARMVAELRGFSAELAERPTGGTLLARMSAGCDRHSEVTSRHAGLIVALLGPAGDQLEQRGVYSDRERIRVVMPRGSAMAVHPDDWYRTERGWLPARWEVPAIELQSDPQCRRWLMYAVNLARTFFNQRHERIREWVKEAKAARAVGTSEWAAKAGFELSSLEAETEVAITKCERAQAFLQSMEVERILPSRRPPEPFPRGSAWIALRQHVINLEQPYRLLPEIVSSALCQPIPVCELPLLYQRWVGLRLLRSLEAQGWAVVGDPVGPLWLGGSVRTKRAGMEVTIFVETRYTSASREGVELECVLGESLTPDFCMVFDSPSGRRTWILDATLSNDPDVVARKQQKYLCGLRMKTPRFVAGIPIFGRPSRSWIASPFGNSIPRLSDSEGVCGTLSVDPALSTTLGLESWLSDLAQYMSLKV